jgi:hypothetical protein
MYSIPTPSNYKGMILNETLIYQWCQKEEATVRTIIQQDAVGNPPAKRTQQRYVFIDMYSIPTPSNYKGMILIETLIYNNQNLTH